MILHVVITKKTVVRAITTVKAPKLLRESVILLIYSLETRVSLVLSPCLMSTPLSWLFCGHNSHNLAEFMEVSNLTYITVVK